MAETITPSRTRQAAEVPIVQRPRTIISGLPPSAVV
jgi:hypothetical protein